MKLSVVSVVKNEESCIIKMLESIKDADEIIILDTGSTDKTGEIVLKYTQNYFANEYIWKDNFAEARNYAIKKCIGDWILLIDADEHLQENGIEKIKKLINLAEQNNQKAVNITMLSEDGTHEHYLPRLFKNNSDIYYEGAIHTSLNINPNNKSNVVIYYGYSDAHKKDPDRALRILKKEVEKNPDKPREIFYLAREYYYRLQFKNAIKYYEDYVTKSKFLAEKADAYLMLAYCYYGISKNEKAKENCLNAININKNFKEALEFMADISEEPEKNKYLEMVKVATNENVLFIRKIKNDNTL